jgi:saccharopine dehydrogenase-like NADP-dependent oxidoreductase
MNVTVLGATGPTGTQLVERALAAGHHVTALVRSPEKLTITNPNLYVIQGDATDRAAVSQAMKGADAVISTLGAKGSVIAAAATAIVAVAVSPTRLTNGPKTEPTVVPETTKVGVLHKISRADVVSFLLQAATDSLYSRRAVIITG